MASLAPLGRNMSMRWRRPARPLVRSLRNERKTQRRFLLRQLRRAALHPDELQGRCLRRRLHAGARGRALHAHLVRARDRNSFRITIIRSSWPKSRRTFNEELLTHHLLEQTSDPKMRAYIINRQIDDIRGTLFRQTMFAEFEKIIHAIEEAGDALTLDVFKSEYRKLLEAYFGDAVRPRSRSSSSNACASRIFTAPFTFTNTPPAFPPRWRSPSASSAMNRTQSKSILAFLNRAGRSSRWKHCIMQEST